MTNKDTISKLTQYITRLLVCVEKLTVRVEILETNSKLKEAIIEYRPKRIKRASKNKTRK